jgi:hypothetical protein
MRKEEVKRLMDDKALKESFQLLRLKLYRDFENADVDDPEELQIIRLKFDLVRDFYSELMKVINDSTIKEFEKRK